MEKNYRSFFGKLLIFGGLATSLVAQGPTVGQPLPSFNLPDQTGVLRSFETLKGPNGLMLVFYRSADW
jgi:hypothetical protein